MNFAEPNEQTATSTVVSPSLRRFPGIQAVETYSPGSGGSSQRGPVSIALKATSPC